MLRKLVIILTILAFLVIIAGIFAFFTTDGFAQFGGSPAGERLEKLKLSPAYSNGKIQNPEEFGVPHRWEPLKMLRNEFFNKEVRQPPHGLPIHQLTRGELEADTADLSITWLGHSTAVLRIEGKTILFDPVWSDRCSPSSVLGPKRFHPVPIAIEDLPPIDAVVISHDHFDHLDMHSVLKLAETNTEFIMPLGVGAHLEKWGIASNRISELDWWETDNSTIQGVNVTATPARHFSGRGGILSNNTLWASLVIESPKYRIFFSGDTGPFPGFTEIGERFGPFDLTLIKIGAYSEDWPDIHLNPEQAIAAHQSLRGKLLLPIHWGTFNLAYHSWDEPIEWLLRESEKCSVKLVVRRPGEIVNLASSPPIDRWWRAP